MYKSAADMTPEEFADHLKMMNDRVMNFKNYGQSVVGTRQDRSYRNAKRGNFQGNVQKTARQGLQELSKMRTDSLGRPRGGKYDG